MILRRYVAPAAFLVLLIGCGSEAGAVNSGDAQGEPTGTHKAAHNRAAGVTMAVRGRSVRVTVHANAPASTKRLVSAPSIIFCGRETDLGPFLPVPSSRIKGLPAPPLVRTIQLDRAPLDFSQVVAFCGIKGRGEVFVYFRPFRDIVRSTGERMDRWDK